MALPSTDSSGNYTEAVGAGEQIAAAGSAIGNATAIGNVRMCVVTGADDTKGVVLPAPFRGRVIEIYSTNAASGLKVYPPVNATINDGTANAAIVVEARLIHRFVGTNSVNWGAAFTVNA